jgi:hypothetical protein
MYAWAFSLPTLIITYHIHNVHTGDDSVDDEIMQSSLVFFFESGKVPFEKIVTSLVDDKNLAWHLITHDDQKRALFRIKKAFDLTLISQPSYLELRVSEAGYSELLLPEIYILACNTIVNVMKGDHLKHQYFHLAFKCTCSQTPNVHLMKISSSEAQPTRAECLHLPLDQQLSKDHLIWFVSARMCAYMYLYL